MIVGGDVLGEREGGRHRRVKYCRADGVEPLAATASRWIGCYTAKMDLADLLPDVKPNTVYYEQLQGRNGTFFIFPDLFQSLEAIYRRTVPSPKCTEAGTVVGIVPQETVCSGL